MNGNYGELKTAFFSALPDQMQGLATGFDFGENFDAAQKLFAQILPDGAVPELIDMRYADRNIVTGWEDTLALPDDFLALIAVRFATRRTTTGVPLMRGARLVAASEYVALRNNTLEPIASLFEDLLHLWPIPAAYRANCAKSTAIIYRKKPIPYLSSSAILPNGLVVEVSQDILTPHVFTFETNNADLYADPTLLRGGELIIPDSTVDEDVNGTVYRLRIVSASRTNRVFTIRVVSDQTIPTGTSSTTVYPTAIVTKRVEYGSGASHIESLDSDCPVLNDVFYPSLIDYAVARYIERKGAFQQAQAMYQRAFQQLNALGAKIEFAKVAEK